MWVKNRTRCRTWCWKELKTFLLVLICSLRFKLLEKVKNILNSDQHQSKICFMLRPVSRMVILASVELNGELMQEIHQIWHWNELEAIFYFVLIAIKGVFNFSVSLKHKEQNNTNKNLFWAPSIIKCDVLICGSSPTLISYFFLIFDNFQNAYLILNIHISAIWQPKIKTNKSKFKSAHWQSKHISVLKILFCCTFYTWSNRSTFLGHLIPWSHNHHKSGGKLSTSELTNVMILTFTLLIFRSFPAIYIWPFLWCIHFAAHKICTMLLTLWRFQISPQVPGWLTSVTRLYSLEAWEVFREILWPILGSHWKISEVSQGDGERFIPRIIFI